MKIYLAAMYQWIDRMKIEREKYRAAGFEITADWIESDEVNQARSRNENAELDLEGIQRADVFALYTLPVGTMFSSGGRMTELGYAIALNKRIIIVGERENVFCHLDRIRVFSTTEDVIKHLILRVGRFLDGSAELRVKINPGMTESDIITLLSGSLDSELKALQL